MYDGVGCARQPSVVDSHSDARDVFVTSNLRASNISKAPEIVEIFQITRGSLILWIQQRWKNVFRQTFVARQADSIRNSCGVVSEKRAATFFFSSHTFTFQLLDKPWSQVSSLLPLGSCLQFLSRIGFSNPTARRVFIECCSLTLSRFPQGNLCTWKSPHEFTRVSVHSGGSELTKLTYTRREDNLIRHRGDRLSYHTSSREG